MVWVTYLMLYEHLNLLNAMSLLPMIIIGGDFTAYLFEFTIPMATAGGVVTGLLFSPKKPVPQRNLFGFGKNKWEII